MIEIILHLGFPKTASSTLQFGPLKELHSEGKINLLTWRLKSKNENLENRPSSSLFRGGQISRNYLLFSEDKLNVLSDESFTAPIRLRQNNFGYKLINPIKFPKMIKDQIDSIYGEDKIKYTCLICIREQSGLIASQYVEEINWKRYLDQDLLFTEEGHLSLNGYEIYEYGKYIEEIVRVFGINSCVVTLYEDLNSHERVFFDEIARILRIDPEWLTKRFSKYHINTKKKSKYGAFAKDGKYFVPFFRDEVLLEVKEFFKTDNKTLKKWVPEVKLKKYRYI